MSDETEVDISLNNNCKKLIDEYIAENYAWASKKLKQQIRIQVTILVERCIYSDCHEINV